MTFKRILHAILALQYRFMHLLAQTVKVCSLMVRKVVKTQYYY